VLLGGLEDLKDCKKELWKKGFVVTWVLALQLE